MSYSLGSSGKSLILEAVIDHLDHKDVSRTLKCQVLQTTSELALKVQNGVDPWSGSINGVRMLCRNLCTCLKAKLKGNCNPNLAREATLIEECLMNIVKEFQDLIPLFELMEELLWILPSTAIEARVGIGALIILAHKLPGSILNNQAVPEGLFMQLLKVIKHPDSEIRTAGHHLFRLVLVPRHWDFKDEGWDELEAVIKRTSGTKLVNLASALNDEQALLLLSTFWVQAVYPPHSLLREIAYSFGDAVFTVKNIQPQTIMSFFQFPLTILRMDLHKDLLLLAYVMLRYNAEAFHIYDLKDFIAEEDREHTHVHHIETKVDTIVDILTKWINTVKPGLRDIVQQLEQPFTLPS